MVNSPSRSISRPVDSPPLGGSVRPAHLCTHSSPLPARPVILEPGTAIPLPLTLNQGKNPSNQGLSSLIKATAKFSIASRLHAGWGRLVPTFTSPSAPKPEPGHPNQGKKPSNRASSRHIKANGKSPKRARPRSLPSPALHPQRSSPSSAPLR